METLPKDILIELALYLPGQDLLSLCRSSKKYNYICESNTFWRKKLLTDYNINENHSPKQIYKTIKENNEICNKNVLNRRNGRKGYVLNEITEENFKNKDDHLIYVFLVSKILEKGKNIPDYYKGLYDRYIDKINYKYDNKILRNTDFPSEEEYEIFLNLLKKVMGTPFQKAYINGILYRGLLPNITWEDLCEYPLY